MPRQYKVLLLSYGDRPSVMAYRRIDAGRATVSLLMLESTFFRAVSREVIPSMPEARLYVSNFTGDLSAILRSVLRAPAPHLSQVCRQCRVSMLRKAAAMMEEIDADLLATGECLSDKDPLRSPEIIQQIDREAGVEGRVLRPLCPDLNDAQQMELLYDGRSADPVTDRIADLPHGSAHNCRLTSPAFFARARDLYFYGGPLSRRELELLPLGRHFRISARARLVVGRSLEENLSIGGTPSLYELLLKTEGVPGPVAVLTYTASAEEVELAAAICARYAQCPPDEKVSVRIRSPRDIQHVQTYPAPDTICEQLLIKPQPELCDRNQ